MQIMKTTDHPGIYLPPPILYAAFFFLSILIQNLFPFETQSLRTGAASVVGWALIAAGVLVDFPALWRFIMTKNTVVTIKPAHSLQTGGIYAFTRNPMYLGLLLVYTGLGVLKGNWWTLILVPFLVLVIQLYIIKKEEDYLQRRFGEEYKAYKKRVRRWI